MKNLLVLMIGVAALLGPAANARSTERMGDPLFGIEYDTQRVHFEAMPASMAALCPDLRTRYTKAWVFAHLKTPDGDYFLVSGLMKMPSEEHRGRFSLEPDEGGMAVGIRGATCIAEQSENFLWQQRNRAMHGSRLTVADAVLNAIAQDALNRYAQAFGSKKVFLKNLTPDDREGLSPPVRKQLEMFEKQP